MITQQRVVLRSFAVVWAALVLMTAVLASPAHAQSADCAIVLDASTSMRGFAPTGNTSRLGEILAALSATCPQRFAFGATFRPWDGRVVSATFSDSTTRLGEALARWRAQSDGGVAIFVTDNVADSGRGNSDQDAFYRALEHPAPGYAFVSVVITRLSFRGQVYPVGPGRGAAYSGPRALTFYILAPTDRAQGSRALAALLLSLQRVGLRAAQSQPSANDYVVVSLAPLALASEQRVPIRLTRSEGAQPLPDGNGVVVNPSSADAQPTFTIEVAPRFSSDWRFRSVRLSSALRFPQSDQFGSASSTPCETTPNQLAQTQIGQPILITCRPTPLAPNLSPQQRQALETRGVVYRPGTLVLTASVNQSALEMAGVLRGWTYDGPASRLATPDRAVQSGVFNLGVLLTRMIPQRQLTADIAQTQVVQRVWLIDAGNWLKGGLGLAAVAALIALVVFALMKRGYEFTGDKSSPTLLTSLRFAEAQLIEPLGGGGLVTVYPLLFGFLLTSRGGRDPVTPQFLFGQGGRFSLGPDGEKLSVKRARLQRQPRRGGQRDGRDSRGTDRRRGGSRR